ncbi:hypothetical protein K1T71_004128 [Dendrolimus kikuchii]|uniref:Uncharacterized protein n=1 Tax=Dendrolimus kikuchii TaxID=765133 RepID=A0ACC1D9S9_9NEOP|nr:hypothetical protein K1T71_004128 [Dendrolimus kikuchii]
MTLSWPHIVILIALYPWLVWSNDIYHLKSIKIFNPPEILPKNAYFGYSVTHDVQRNRLIASAPRASNIGSIYSCDFDQKNNCTNVECSPAIRREYDKYDHDYWLGATVAGGPDYYVTCAPRHIARSQAYKAPGEFAFCYISAENGVSLNKLTTLKNPIGTDPFFGIEKIMDSFGWSIAVHDKSILIGGPAMYTGRAIYYKTKMTNAEPVRTKIPYNFGYSVAFGNFFAQKRISFAVSSTYGRYGEGSISLYRNTNDVTPSAELSKGKDTVMVGTMFGAVLCAAKLSSGKDALIVGAPAYAHNKEYNVGAVYVYSPSYRILEFKRIIKGFRSGSFFGSAIASAGDLNGDQNDEIAIAAPYEDDGRGAVYLYSGETIQSNQVEITWLQKIQPKEFGPLSTFGLSLSALRDYDENGCNELAIGAPGIDKVAVLQCMAAVTVQLRAEFPNLQKRKGAPPSEFDMSETFAKFKSCLNVSYPEKPKDIEAKINIKIELTHPSAKLENEKDGAFSYIVPLDKEGKVKGKEENSKEYCKLIGLILPTTGNYNLKIGYMITATLLNNPVDSEEFIASRVILSDRSILSTSGSVWAAECERGDACEPKLNLTLHYGPSNEYKYLIGSTDQERISITITNEGEPAYSSCVTVRTEGVPIRSLPATNCARVSNQNNVIKCEPPMALKPGENWNTLDIELVTKDLTNMDTEFHIYTELFDNCGSANKSYKQTTKFVLEKESSGITVSGSTQNYVDNTVNLTRLELSNMKQVEHRYIFKNRGLTNWKQVTCEVRLKNTPYINFNSENGFEIKDGQCSASSLIGDYWSANCTINKIFKKFENSLHVYIDLISPDDLGQLLQNKNLTIESSITLYIDGKQIKESIASTITLREVEVPLWIIICAVIVGLLILILIFMILHELGCLKRKNQRKLEDLRKSIRRQTIRRSMMAQERQRIVSQACEAVEENNMYEGLDNPGQTDSKRDLENKIMEELRNKNLNKK